MESVDIIAQVRDIGVLIIGAKGLVDDGKEVLCSRRLQGALVKLSNLLGNLQELSDGNVVNKTTEEVGESVQ